MSSPTWRDRGSYTPCDERIKARFVTLCCKGLCHTAASHKSIHNSFHVHLTWPPSLPLPHQMRTQLLYLIQYGFQAVRRGKYSPSVKSRRCAPYVSVDQGNIHVNYAQDISRLLSLAASSISLLTLPQTDGPDDGLPQGGERSEQFVLEVSEYFDLLDVCCFAPLPLHASQLNY